MQSELKVLNWDLGIEDEKIVLMPLSDLHIGSNFNEDLFLKYRKWVLSQKNAYVLLNGDIVEMVTKDSVGDIFESLRPKEQKKLAVKFLEPLAKEGRLLAYVDGNHEHRLSKNTDIFVGEEICERLGVPSIYDPNGVYIFLTMGYEAKHNKNTRITYTIYMRHGHGGGRTKGAKANNLEKMSNKIFADIFISSHVHEQMNFPDVFTVPDPIHKKLNYIDSWFVSSGSFLNWSGYAIRGGYNPTKLGSSYLILNGRRKGVQIVSG